MSGEPQPFIAYWDAVDATMRQLFGIDTMDTGIDAGALAAAQDEGWTPQTVALWLGKRHRLSPL